MGEMLDGMEPSSTSPYTNSISTIRIDIFSSEYWFSTLVHCCDQGVRLF